MATGTVATRLVMQLDAMLTVDAPFAQGIRHMVENSAGGRRWTDGTASGQVSQVYLRRRAGLAAGDTDTYNLLAPGALLDVLGGTIDADELKAIMVVPTAGAIRIAATPANFIGIFEDADGKNKIPAGSSFAMDFGPTGLDVSSGSKFEITETTGAATADYDLILIVAE